MSCGGIYQTILIFDDHYMLSCYRVIMMYYYIWYYIDGLVQKKKYNSSALVIELRLSCTNPWLYDIIA